MNPETYLAKSYRNLVVADNPASAAEQQWNRVCAQEESFWEKIFLRDRVLSLRLDSTREVRLSSLTPADLPPLSEAATGLGRWLARRSLFARVLSSRVGKEEVTFYALLNEAQGGGLDGRLDRWLLNVGHAPLCYRRRKVVEVIRRSLLEMIQQRKTQIGFLDIGSGGGFDGLDVHRICAAIPGVRCQIVNIDIDGVWLALNERIATAVGAAGIQRRHVSVFDYLRDQTWREDWRGVDDLIISCNGFADFFDDAAIREMLAGIRRIFEAVPGRVRFIFPAALKKSRAQTFLSRLIGFNYAGRTPQAFLDVVAAGLGGYPLTHEEKHSQIICVVRKN